jgi:hypothetical protein
MEAEESANCAIAWRISHALIDDSAVCARGPSPTSAMHPHSKISDLFARGTYWWQAPKLEVPKSMQAP